MKKVQIESSLQTGKLALSFGGKFTHFFIVIFLLAFSLMYLFIYLKVKIEGKGENMDIEMWLLLPSLVSIVVAIISYIVQSNRLKFKVIETDLPRKKLDEIIETVAIELKWHHKRKGNKYLILKTRPSFWSGSWGEQITILFDKGQILVNSICDLDGRPSMTSMGRNKENVERLVEEIKKANG